MCMVYVRRRRSKLYARSGAGVVLLCVQVELKFLYEMRSITSRRRSIAHGARNLRSTLYY